MHEYYWFILNLKTSSQLRGGKLEGKKDCDCLPCMPCVVDLRFFNESDAGMSLSSESW